MRGVAMGAASATNVLQLAGVPARRKFTGLLPQEDHASWLAPFRERAQARLFEFQPITVKDRFDGFRLIRFRPHGIFLPSDPQLQTEYRRRLYEIGQISRIEDERDVLEGDRITAYQRFQDETEALCLQGVPGQWTGQQQIARSPARFRIAALGRRAGKTKEAAAEALGIALVKPRSVIWLAAPTAKLVDRSWQYVLEMLDDLGLRGDCQIRDGVQERRCITPNRSRIEGVSCENVMSMAGDKVDFAIVDECAQIVPDVWERGILPPLADRRGCALLISSYEGEGDFFSNKIADIRKEEERSQIYGFAMPDKRWEVFEAPSYDVNFYAFPQGIETKSLKDMQSEMDVATFNEQFGAHVMGSRDRVYPEFNEQVHVGNYPFNPEKEVHLACDPASSANPYAISVIQDYGDYIVVIDELYEKQFKAEDYDPVMRRRPWASNVIDMVVDSAWPHDIARWNGLGWNAYPVQKPLIQESIPLVKNYLRNGKLYDQYLRLRVNEVLAEFGYDTDEDVSLPEHEQKRIYLEVAQRMERLTEQDVVVLKECSRLFVNQMCTNTIREFKSYANQRRRNLGVNYKETPRDYENHIMDALRYFLWMNHRFDSDDHPKLRSYVKWQPPRELPEGVTEAPRLTDEQRRGRMWLDYHRGLYARNTVGRSYLRRTA